MNIDRVLKDLNSFSYRNIPLIVFVTLTLGGCIFIAVSKIWGLSPMYSMGVPVLIMFSYLGLSMISGKVRLHDEQTGDNLYYMGFLFTLASLGVSLYLFTSDGSTDEVVRNFGIAITSTICGISLRIFYNQMRRDVLDIERATRHDLATMARRVRSELEGSAREFASLRRVNNQMVNEGFEDIINQVNETSQKLTSTMENMVTEALKPINEASVKFSDAIEASVAHISSKLSDIALKVDSSGEVFDKANSGMAASTSQLGSHVDSVAKKLEQVMVPEAVLKDELGPLVKELGKIVVDYGIKTEAASKEQAARMDSITLAVSKIVEIAGKSILLMDKSVESADTLTRNVHQQNTEMQRLLASALNESRAISQQKHTFEPIASPGAISSPVVAQQAPAVPPAVTSTPPAVEPIKPTPVRGFAPLPIETPPVAPPPMPSNGSEGESKKSWWPKI